MAMDSSEAWGEAILLTVTSTVITKCNLSASELNRECLQGINMFMQFIPEFIS